jgi:hypothetical protein
MSFFLLSMYIQETHVSCQFQNQISKTCKVVLAYLEANPNVKSKVKDLYQAMEEWVRLLSKAKGL